MLRRTIKKFWEKEARLRYRPTVECRRPSIGKPGDTSSAESLRFGLCLHKARPQRIRPPPQGRDPVGNGQAAAGFRATFALGVTAADGAAGAVVGANAAGVTARLAAFIGALAFFLAGFFAAFLAAFTAAFFLAGLFFVEAFFFAGFFFATTFFLVATRYFFFLAAFFLEVFFAAFFFVAMLELLLGLTKGTACYHPALAGRASNRRADGSSSRILRRHARVRGAIPTGTAMPQPG